MNIKSPVWEVDKIGVPQSCLSAMEHLVTVFALDIQRLAFVNHLDVFPQCPFLAQRLSTMITHVPAIMF